MNYRDYNDFELIDKVSESEEANEILFKKYKPLIVGIAKKNYNPNNGNGLDLNDLISEGMIGFSTAINTFKPDKDTIFFTYAKTCIERRIFSAVLSSNRLKHRLLNESLSMEETDDESVGLKNIIGDESLNPEKLVITNETTLEILETLDKEFSDFEKQVFELKRSGFEIAEIAEVLDKDYKSVDNTLQRIKTKIKKVFNKND